MSSAPSTPPRSSRGCSTATSPPSSSQGRSSPPVCAPCSLGSNTMGGPLTSPPCTIATRRSAGTTTRPGCAPSTVGWRNCAPASTPARDRPASICEAAVCRRLLRLVAGGDQPALVGDRHEPGAVVAVELAQDVADVGLGGQRADHEPAGDLLVGEAAGDKEQDVALPVGQLGQRGRRHLRVAAGGELGDQTARDLG